jgi:hypothetical protein
LVPVLVRLGSGDTFNISCFRDQGELMMITNMRHPIERIVSSYW